MTKAIFNAWRFVGIVALIPALTGSAAPVTKSSLMPWPSQVDFKSGSLSLDRPLRIEASGCDQRVTHAVGRFRGQLSAQTGNLYLR